MVLDVLAGRRAVGEACRQLRLSERRFHALRVLALQAALGGLEPRPSGRPAQQPAEGEQEEVLRATIRDLQLDLRAARVREEIALTMPDLPRPPARGQGARAQRRRAQRETSAGRGGCGPSARAARHRASAGGGRQGSARPGGASGVSAPAPSPSAAGPAGLASP
jgi:hypothetical protein